VEISPTDAVWTSCSTGWDSRSWSGLQWPRLRARRRRVGHRCFARHQRRRPPTPARRPLPSSALHICLTDLHHQTSSRSPRYRPLKAANAFGCPDRTAGVGRSGWLSSLTMVHGSRGVLIPPHTHPLPTRKAFRACLSPCAATSGTDGSDGAAAQQGAAATRPRGVRCAPSVSGSRSSGCVSSLSWCCDGLCGGGGCRGRCGRRTQAPDRPAVTGGR
jgi:hypothetical protein